MEVSRTKVWSTGAAGGTSSSCYYRPQCEDILLVEITIAMGRTTVQILFLYKHIERDIQIIFKSFHFRWVCSAILHCEEMTVNPFVGNRYSHFLPNLMISSSLPSAGTVRQRTNFRVYSPISSSLQLGVANKKSMRMINLICVRCF